MFTKFTKWNFRRGAKPKLSKQIYRVLIESYYRLPWCSGQPFWNKELQNNYYDVNRAFLWCMVNVHVACTASVEDLKTQDLTTITPGKMPLVVSLGSKLPSVTVLITFFSTSFFTVRSSLLHSSSMQAPSSAVCMWHRWRCMHMQQWQENLIWVERLAGDPPT